MVAIVRQEGQVPAMGATNAYANFVHDWSPINPTPGAQQTLEIYSNCDSVELFLNNQSLGTKPINKDASPRTWRVPFAAGTLKAVGKNKDQIAATDQLTTAEKPAAISAKSDREKITPSFEDVAIVEVLAQDNQGITNPHDNDLVKFQITGPGKIIAVDNGDAGSHEPYQAMQHHLLNGRAIAILRATAPGEIILTTSIAGLPNATTKITATEKNTP